MNSEEYGFVAAQLSEGKSIEDTAEALVMRRATEEVEYVANDLAAREEQGRWFLSRRFYTLYAPEAKPVKVQEIKAREGVGGTEIWEKPGRQQYRVLV